MTEQQVAYGLLYFVLGMLAPPVYRFVRRPKSVDLVFSTDDTGRTWSAEGKPLAASPLTDTLQDAYMDYLNGRPIGSTSIKNLSRVRRWR